MAALVGVVPSGILPQSGFSSAGKRDAGCSRFAFRVLASKKSKASKRGQDYTRQANVNSLPLLEEFESADSSDGRDAAAGTLEELGSEQSVTSLEEFLQSRSQGLRTSAGSDIMTLRWPRRRPTNGQLKKLQESEETVEVWEGNMPRLSKEEESDFAAEVELELNEIKRRHGAIPPFSEDDEGDTGVRTNRVPAVMRCFDRAKIYVKAGDGGKGEVAFRREKFVPFGGPSGGNGGRGGNVYLEVDNSLNSLLGFRKCVHFRAGRGKHGLGKSQDGAFGEDCAIRVPPGTLVREADEEPGTGKLLMELTKPGQRELLLPGGRGGRGNASFKSSRNKAPQLAENGEEGLEMWLELELKLVADVGIIGVPNAGKSTLLSAISAAKPEISAYPFTTLLPNLGVVSLGFDATMVVADLPGLLEGAHTGYGLGHEFLRHTERCRVLIHIIDGTSSQPEYEYEAVRLELELFNPRLSSKACVVVFNKMDIPEVADRWPSFQEAMQARGVTPLCISAATTEGTAEVVGAAYNQLKAAKETAPLPDSVSEGAFNNSIGVAEMLKRERSAPIEEFQVSRSSENREWYVEGAGLERFVQMTNWEYFESMQRFERILECSGVNNELKARGVQEGDQVVIGERAFTWHDSKDIERDIVNVGKFRRSPRGSKHWPH